MGHDTDPMMVCPRCGRRSDKDYCAHDGTRMVAVTIFGEPVDPLIGKVFDKRYRVMDVIGYGGMGTVYRAVQLTMNRQVALKVMKPELTENRTLVGRFQREARAAGQLNHHNVISIFDFGQSEDGTLYMVTELLFGETLADRLVRSGRLHPHRAIDIACQILGALNEAHQRGIVHRDLKPDNIFLTTDEHDRDVVKVLDFGMVKLIGATDPLGKLTRTGVVGGTPAFMSPENAQGLKVDGRADLYSLGVILYEMLTGRLPFTAEDSVGLMLAHINDPVPPLTAPGVTFPERLRETVMWCLAKEPKDRPIDAETLELHLKRAAMSIPPSEEVQLQDPRQRRRSNDPRDTRPDKESGLPTVMLPAASKRGSELPTVPEVNEHKSWLFGRGFIIVVCVLVVAMVLLVVLVNQA